METKLKPIYDRLSSFLDLKELALGEDVARLSNVIQVSYENKLITKGTQVVPLMYSYFIGKGKLKDEYRKILDDYVVDLMELVDDYLQFNDNIKLF